MIYVCSLGFLLNCQFIFCHVLLTWVMRWCAPLDALPWSTSKTKSLWDDKYMKAYEEWVASPLDIGGLITIRVSKHSCHICHIFCCMFIENLLYILLNLYTHDNLNTMCNSWFLTAINPAPSTPSTLQAIVPLLPYGVQDQRSWKRPRQSGCRNTCNTILCWCWWMKRCLICWSVGVGWLGWGRIKGCKCLDPRWFVGLVRNGVKHLGLG